MNINYNSIIKAFIPVFIILFIAYFINSVLYIYLPKAKEQKQIEQSSGVEYNKYKIYDGFNEPKKITQKPKPKAIKKEYELLSSIVLKAIYASSDKSKGWIIISEKSSTKTHMLEVLDSFKNYTLKSVYKKYVIFEKNSKEYKLSIDDEKNIQDIKTKTVVKKQVLADEEIKEEEGGYSVKRELVNEYTKGNLNKIFKDIAIKEIKKDGKIDGFKINRVSKNSVFYKLGLKKNDIIKEVNNIKLQSYNDAFKIYNQMNKLNSLNFIILRNNQPVEIEYEIK